MYFEMKKKKTILKTFQSICFESISIVYYPYSLLQKLGSATLSIYIHTECKCMLKNYLLNYFPISALSISSVSLFLAHSSTQNRFLWICLRYLVSHIIKIEKKKFVLNTQNCCLHSFSNCIWPLWFISHHFCFVFFVLFQTNVTNSRIHMNIRPNDQHTNNKKKNAFN